MPELLQGVSAIVPVGPFLDVTDGVTPETGVTLTGGGDNADEAEVLKSGGAATVDISSNTWAAITGCDGWYHLTLTAGNLDTPGPLTVVVQNDSEHRPVYAHFDVKAFQAIQVVPMIPSSIDLANTASVRLGLGLINTRGDLPATAEITPGTITIDSKALNGTTWGTIVNAAACSEVDGLVYYDEVFDGVTGYAENASIRITFKSIKVTVDSVDYEICGTDGLMFQTFIRAAIPTSLAVIQRTVVET